jgi:hypothetical protein
VSARILGALTLVIVGALLWLAVPALAHHTDQTDPNDTPGAMDLEKVAFDHDGTPTWRFVAFADWTIRQMWDHGYLMVQLDTKGGPAVDYLVVVRSVGSELDANLFRIRSNGREVKISRLKTGKAGSRAAWVSMNLSKVIIGSRRTSYFWSAKSSFIGPACRQTCFDTVPDVGMIEQTLSTSPTPTPTPTPTAATGPTG